MHEAMIVIEQDGSNVLGKDFINIIFSKIYTSVDGNAVPLEPLADAMKY